MTALCDTGAQTPLVISPRAAKVVADTLGATIKQLPKPMQYVDYREKIAGKATKFVEASLEIDSRRFLKQRFVITESDHDVFISLKCCAQDRPPANPEHQKDARRRDQKWEAAQKRYQILNRDWRRPPDPNIGENIKDAAIIAGIESATKTDPRQTRWEKLKHLTPTEPVQIRTFETSRIVALKSWKTYDGKAILFPEGEDEVHKALVRSKIPKALAHMEGFFSKVQADTLRG
ncbi:uncharacterized protein CPUR_05221 [Claviceps purpurea 20.1]|uniref:Uncharacterized protein n=1 Tax=Claviceps purpurea (strain 20.1) TaxID=1111077 RepID=M1WBZ6_CLAP2|nr:uncharacterized protein CPUR_05221 [Claviceps purpurea 20.1]